MCGKKRGCLVGGVEAEKRCCSFTQVCICWGVLAAGGRSQNNDLAPPQLYAVVQLLHTTYQKGLGKSLPNKLTYASTFLPLNK